MDTVTPQAPNNFRVLDLSKTSVTTAWDADTSHKGQNVTYDIGYHVIDDVTTDWYESEIQSTYFKVTSLKPNTTYIFWALAVNKAGLSPNSNTIDVTTGEKGR